MDKPVSETDNRQIARDSLFLLAQMRLLDSEIDCRIKVRNLSSGGMMGEGPVAVRTGEPVSIEVRNIGWVEGRIAWVQQPRFGVAFTQAIDPKLAREPLREDGEQTPRFLRDYENRLPSRENLRKI